MARASKVLEIATAELGYLEKASNSQLDSKTANAGSGNYTKYWRDMKPEWQGQPWCDCFVKWCFWHACGGDTDAAKKLCYQGGKEWSYYTPTSAQYYKNRQRYFAVPQVGDQVFFKDSVGTICHTGIVEKVTGTSITTIEGNASGASGVTPNGGGVVRKNYVRNYVRIAGYGRPDYDDYGEEEELNATQEKQLRRIYDEVTRLDDPTGRKKRLNDHDHIKWIAKGVTETQELTGDLAARMTAVENKMESVETKLDEIIAQLIKR